MSTRNTRPNQKVIQVTDAGVLAALMRATNAYVELLEMRRDIADLSEASDSAHEIRKELLRMKIVSEQLEREADINFPGRIQ